MSIKRNTDSNADSKASPEPGNEWRSFSQATFEANLVRLEDLLQEAACDSSRKEVLAFWRDVDAARSEISSTRAAIPAALFDAKDVVWSDLGEIALAEAKLKQQLDLVRACPELVNARKQAMRGRKNVKRMEHLWDEAILFERIKVLQMLGKEAKKVDLMAKAITRYILANDRVYGAAGESPLTQADLDRMPTLWMLLTKAALEKAALGPVVKGMHPDDHAMLGTLECVEELEAAAKEADPEELRRANDSHSIRRAYRLGLCEGAFAKARELVEGMTAGRLWEPAHLSQTSGHCLRTVLDWADVDGNLWRWLLVKHGVSSDVYRVCKADSLERWGVK